MKRVETVDHHRCGWWFFCRGDQLLVSEKAQPIPQGSLSTLGVSLDSWTGCYLLGEYQGQACLLVDVEHQHWSQPWGRWRGMRSLLSRLDDDLFMMAGRACQVAHFIRTHQYCGRCAERMQEVSWELAMQCRDCGHRAYPRVSPVVIMAVHHQERILLARSRKGGREEFSVLAGFVEAGETLEQAVAREVMEEVGLEVTNIQYFGSQPWPFPHNLMVAFTVQYAAGEITIEPRELAEAHWYGVDELPSVSSPQTIAGRMINDFVTRARKKKTLPEQG